MSDKETTVSLNKKYLEWEPDKVRIIAFRNESNNLNVYDDDLYLLVPDIGIHAFKCNTDPSKRRPGQGFGAEKGMAHLVPGQYYVHILGIHKGAKSKTGHLALVQRRGTVKVMRDGKYEMYDDEGKFGINIHMGGYKSTSSEGCQTLHPDSWVRFIALVKKYVDADVIVPYWLVG